MPARILQNRLLEKLFALDPELRNGTSSLTIARGETVNLKGASADLVHFPTSGILATQTGTAERPIQLAMIGPEGMTGTDRLMHDSPASFTVAALTDCTAVSIPMQDILASQLRSPGTSGIVLAYARAYGVQISMNVAAAAHHAIRVRAARWLLMAADRMGDEMAVTHSLIARSLSTRRAGITTLLHGFEGEGMLTAGRAHIRLLDRRSLAAVCEDSYGFAEAEYDRFLG